VTQTVATEMYITVFISHCRVNPKKVV